MRIFLLQGDGQEAAAEKTGFRPPLALTAHTLVLALVTLAVYARKYLHEMKSIMPHCRTDASIRPTGGRAAMALASALLVVVGLSGCSTAQIDAIPKEIGGLPEGAPKRADAPPDYPAVHDMPPPRAATLLDEDQQKRMEADLIAARNRQPGQEKNRIKDAQKKAKEEARAKKPKGSRKDKVRQQPTALQPGASEGRFNQAGANQAGANQGAPAAGNGPAWPSPAVPQPAGFGITP